jgi:hypothetical protein
MTYTLIIELAGAPAAAVAVEWTAAAAPEADGEGWAPCTRVGPRHWRLSSHAAGGEGHLRGPGRFGDIAIRYRLEPHGPWSRISEDRKAVEIVAVDPEAAPPAPGAEDWTAPAATTLGAAGTCAAFLGLGPVSAAASVEWTLAASPAAADWQPCLAFAGGLWALAGPLATAGALNPAEVAIRYRLAPDAPWSAASAPKRLAALMPVAPELLEAPGIEGDGVIGAALIVSPGLWAGVPAPMLSHRWRRDGVDIPGATAASYVPVPADDGCVVSCLETAANPLGSRTAEAAGLPVAWAAPQPAGEPDDVILDVGSGDYTLDAAVLFQGGGLVFSVSGARATIDAATGRVSIPTDAEISDIVVITATNSGGAAELRFPFTVEGPAEPLPFPLAAGDIVLGASLWRPAGQETWFTPVVSFPGLAGETVDAIEWTTGGKGTDAEVPEHQFEVVTQVSADGGEDGLPVWQLYMRDPAMNNPLATPRTDYSVWQAGTARQDYLRFRWRRKADGKWSPLSVAVRVDAAATVPEQPEPPEPPQDGSLWRPMIRRHVSQLGVKPDHPQHFAAGLYGGETMQFFQGGARGLSDPDFIVINQDMAPPRQSRDGGLTWLCSPNHGYDMVGGISVAIDPADPNVVMTLASGAAYGGAKPEIAAREGLWRSTDRGISWSLVRAMPVVRDARWYHDTLACWPLSGGSAAGRKWRALVPGQDNVLRYMVSTGGTAWSEIALPAAMANNRAYALIQDPKAEGTLWACTSSGLWRTTDEGASWSRPFASFTFAHAGATNTNNGDGISCAWIDPENTDRMIVGRRGKTAATRGLFFKTAAGDSWTKVRDLPVGHFALGPLSGGTRRIYVHQIDAPRELHVAAWTGSGFSGWTVPGVANYFPGDGTGHYTQLSGREQCFALPHPVKPLECVIQGFGVFWRTEDGGLSWSHSSTGLGGLGMRKCKSADGKTILIALADIQCITSTDNGLSMELHTVAGSQKDSMRQVANYAVDLVSGTDIVMLPDHASVPAAKRGRLIMAAGAMKEHAIFLKNRVSASPPSWEAQWRDDIAGRPVANGGGVVARHNIDYSRQNPNRVYCGPNRSDDGGDTWQQIAGQRKFLAMSQQDGNVIYVQNGVMAVAKSVDGGASVIGADFLAPGYNITNTVAKGLFWLSPHNDRLALYPAANGDVARVLGDPGSASTMALGLRNLLKPVPPALTLADCGFDPRDPRVFYVLLDVSGRSSIWKGTFAADYGSASFEDITRNGPRTGFSNSLSVIDTGEVVVGGGMGVWVHPAHGDAANPCWSKLALPFENHWQDA